MQLDEVAFWKSSAMRWNSFRLLSGLTASAKIRKVELREQAKAQLLPANER